MRATQQQKIKRQMIGVILIVNSKYVKKQAKDMERILENVVDPCERDEDHQFGISQSMQLRIN